MRSTSPLDELEPRNSRLSAHGNGLTSPCAFGPPSVLTFVNSNFPAFLLDPPSCAARVASFSSDRLFFEYFINEQRA